MKRNPFKFLVTFMLPAVAMLAEPLIPVTSHRIDVDDDPENDYSGAPMLSWADQGGRMRLAPRLTPQFISYRNTLGLDFENYWIYTDSFELPPSVWEKPVLEDTPLIPIYVHGKIGKYIWDAESGERSKAFALEEAMTFIDAHPNAILGGGAVAEFDDIITYAWDFFYGRPPIGPGGRIFPTAFFEHIEAQAMDSPVPYLAYQLNAPYGMYLVAKERLASRGGPQLFHRGTHTMIEKILTARGALRQSPYPLGIQFSGQVKFVITNPSEVAGGAEPIFEVTNSITPSYGKSLALNRQMLYWAWLQGAKIFNYEGPEWINLSTPGPLALFVKDADDFIASFGPVGPVQTPIAVISEFSNTWRPAEFIHTRKVRFEIVGEAPYSRGDYHLGGLHGFYYPGYLQNELIYSQSMLESYAFSPTPYGDSVDFLLSDVREEALARYGLLIWGGIPPVNPSLVRDKFERHVANGGSRALLFGEAARAMFPERFQNASPTTIPAGASVQLDGQAFSESAAFNLYSLTDTAGFTIRATVNGQPLIVEDGQGLVIVLSDYALNKTQYYDPNSIQFTYDTVFTKIPYQVLEHAKRLLQIESSRYIPFTIGNDKLHYVVTRPGAGTWLVGLFNDSLGSETFSIQSNIGSIISMEEIDLQDNKAFLKSVSGGAGYAPPGLRDPGEYPIDLGLSDASHIEGRDFRLFRVTLNETGVDEIGPVQFPPRPAARVLAVQGLEDIRGYIQSLPSFFDWFDGVKVAAADLLTLSDPWITEQAFWLNRRGVRVVVDAAESLEPEILQVIAKMSPLNDDQCDLLVNSPSPTVEAVANANGINLIHPGSVTRVYRKGDRLSETGRLNILERYYNREEDLYLDLTHFRDGAVVDKIRGSLSPVQLLPTLQVTGDVSSMILYTGPYISNLTAMLHSDYSDYPAFSGVKVDATYLHAKTEEQLLVDTGTLDTMGLEIIVDLRRDQMHFDRISFYPHQPAYAGGLEFFADIIAKMQLIGAENLILRLEDVGTMQGKPVYMEQRDTTWMRFADQALAAGINLHLIVEPGLTFSAVANFAQSNVFVISGYNPGTDSPYKLVSENGTLGRGSTVISDFNRGRFGSSPYDDSGGSSTLSFDDWARQYGVPADTSDYDNDGSNNFEEFIWGGNPTQRFSNVYSPIEIFTEGGHLIVYYPRRFHTTDNYFLETSENLSEWVNEGFIEDPNTEALDSEFEWVRNEILSFEPRRFIRLRVE